MSKFIPQEDGYLILQLPGERLRAIIRRVVTDNAAIVEITSYPLAKSHTYQRGDYVACRRKVTDFGEIWEAVAEQKISLEQVAEKIVAPKPKKKKPVKKTAPKKKGVKIATNSRKK